MKDELNELDDEIEDEPQSGPNLDLNSGRLSHITKSSCWFMSRAMVCRAGYGFSKFFRKFTDKRLRPFRKDFHTFLKLPILQTF